MIYGAFLIKISKEAELYEKYANGSMGIYSDIINMSNRKRRGVE
jgi:hypothetical protein